MSVESDLVTALTPLVGVGRVYRGIPPQGVTALPRITYQNVGGVALNYLERAVIGERNARIQVNAWAANESAAVALANQIEATLRTDAILQVTVLGAWVQTDERENQLFGSRQDFSLWGA